MVSYGATHPASQRKPLRPVPQSCRTALESRWRDRDCLMRSGLVELCVPVLLGDQDLALVFTAPCGRMISRSKALTPAGVG